MRIREARPEDAAALARVHVASWRTTYRGIVPDAHLAALSEEDREAMWRDVLARGGSLVLVAEDEGGVFGFASGGPTREPDLPFDAELYAIYLLRERQGHGAGRALVGALAEGLLARGLASMVVWVLARNPACRFYEALGGERVASRPDEIGGATLEEVAYAWRDLRALTPAGRP